MSDFFSVEFLETLRDRLLPGLWPLLLAFVACALVVPLMILLSRRSGLMAMPSERHPHTKPTPLLGGAALFIGFAAAVVIFVPQSDVTTGVLIVSGLATL